LVWGFITSGRLRTKHAKWQSLKTNIWFKNQKKLFFTIEPFSESNKTHSDAQPSVKVGCDYS
jgi:hypothetical protein